MYRDDAKSVAKAKRVIEENDPQKEGKANRVIEKINAKRRALAQKVSAKLGRVRVVDIVERIDVCTVPFYNNNGHVSTLYKLQMKLYPESKYPAQSGLTGKECKLTLETVFVEAMEHAIEKHLDLLHKINEIRAVKANETDDTLSDGVEESENRPADGEGTGMSDDDDDNDNADDMGADAEKRKLQEKDEIEYDDDVEKEEGMDSESEEDTKVKLQSQDDGAESGEDSQEAEEGRDILKSEIASVDDKQEGAKLQEEKPDEQKQDKKAQRRRKKLKRTFRVDVTELECVIEYTFYDEPHILLAQVTSFLIRTTGMLFF
jgi:DNA-directed RNA polymerase I subunit RPA1